MKSAGTASKVAAVAVHGALRALVAAHDQAVDLLAVVDEQVGVAQRRQRAGPGAAGTASVTTYWCDIGTIGTRTPARRAISAANMPPQSTTTSHSMSPRSVRTPVTRPLVRWSIAVTRVRCAIVTPAARAEAASA